VPRCGWVGQGLEARRRERRRLMAPVRPKAREPTMARTAREVTRVEMSRRREEVAARRTALMRAARMRMRVMDGLRGGACGTGRELP